jgi:hypothetical protein
MTMSTLHLADTLALPADEAVTQKYGFIGRSGSGKSYASMRLAELFLEHGAQIIALDWVGIWWSLRLAANGKAPGFEHVYIFGGEHADVDLRPESGALMADLVVDKHISVVLDVMHFRKAERTRFATAFAEQFFHRKKTARTACHLFIEEAHAYLPQMVRGDEARMVGVFEDIGKVGRNYGIGTSLITQRPQAINKDVLNQVEVLLAFQTNGPQERKALAGWTSENTDAGAAMIQELPKLHVGHALVWSPQWLRIARQVRISERVTYDASSTPTQQAKSIRPKTLAKADLEQLGEQITATIEKAKAEDPRELRKTIAELRAQLVKAEQAKPSAPAKTIEVPVLKDAQIARVEQLVQRFEAMSARADDLSDKAITASAELKGALDRAKVSPPPQQAQPRQDVQSHRVAPRPATPRPVALDGDASMKGGKFREMLVALAQAGRPLADSQVTARAGMALSGTFDKYLGIMRTNGWVQGNREALEITREGLAALGSYEPLPTGVELQRHWLAKLGNGKKQEMLRVLIEAYPNALSDAAVAQLADMARSGTFDKYLGQLRSLMLVTGQRSSLRASEELF